jgi:cytochrome c556
MAMRSRFGCLTGPLSRSRRYNDYLRSRGHADLARDDDRRRRQNAVASSQRFQDGGETKALPPTWGDKPDLDARYAKLGQDATAALATIKDQASFAAMPAISKNCGGCHEKYRASEN